MASPLPKSSKSVSVSLTASVTFLVLRGHVCYYTRQHRSLKSPTLDK